MFKRAFAAPWAAMLGIGPAAATYVATQADGKLKGIKRIAISTFCVQCINAKSDVGRAGGVSTTYTRSSEGGIPGGLDPRGACRHSRLPVRTCARPTSRRRVTKDRVPRRGVRVVSSGWVGLVLS
jgi:hypothetical protein